MAADVLVHHHAVDHEEALEAHGARDGDGPAGGGAGAAGGTGVVHAWRQRQRLLQAAVERQLLDQVGLVAGRQRRALREVGAGRLGLHHDLFGHAGQAQGHRQRHGLGDRDARAALQRLEAGQLEGDVVVAGGQEGEDVVAVGGRGGGPHALQRGGRHVDGHARQRRAVLRHDLARDGARGVPLRPDLARQGQEARRGQQERPFSAHDGPLLPKSCPSLGAEGRPGRCRRHGRAVSDS